MARARDIPSLRCHGSFRRAAGQILEVRFDELMLFAERVLASGEGAAGVEAVYDLRVASRRLRAALEIFRDVFPRRRLRPMLAEIKNLAAALGTVRDLDVAIARLEADRSERPRPQIVVLDAMIEESRALRSEAHDTVRMRLLEMQQRNFAHHFRTFVSHQRA